MLWSTGHNCKGDSDRLLFVIITRTGLVILNYCRIVAMLVLTQNPFTKNEA